MTTGIGLSLSFRWICRQGGSADLANSPGSIHGGDGRGRLLVVSGSARGLASVLLRIASSGGKRQSRVLIGYGLPGKTAPGHFQEISNLR